jgi:hypothetical protein
MRTGNRTSSLTSCRAHHECAAVRQQPAASRSVCTSCRPLAANRAGSRCQCSNSSRRMRTGNRTSSLTSCRPHRGSRAARSFFLRFLLSLLSTTKMASPYPKRPEASSSRKIRSAVVSAPIRVVGCEQEIGRVHSRLAVRIAEVAQRDGRAIFDSHRLFFCGSCSRCSPRQRWRLRTRSDESSDANRK